MKFIGEIPLFIPILAAAYLAAVYVVLTIAERLRAKQPSCSGDISKASN